MFQVAIDHDERDVFASILKIHAQPRGTSQDSEANVMVIEDVDDEVGF